MREPQVEANVPYPRAASRASAIVYVLLILLALSAFAPSVILPEWRSYQTLRMAEQVAQDRLDRLQGVIRPKDRDRLEAAVLHGHIQ